MPRHAADPIVFLDTMNRVEAVQPIGLHEALSHYTDAVARPSAELQPCVDAVRAFERERLRVRHDPHPLLNFFAEHLLGELDLGGLEHDPEASARRINRLLGDVGAAAAAIEFGALTRELDYAVASNLGDRPPTVMAYVRAYRAVGRRAERERQLGLVAFVAEDLSGVARSKLAYSAFKLARRPVRAAGFAAIYDLSAAGFDAVRADKAAEQRIAEWLDTEQSLIQRLLG